MHSKVNGVQQSATISLTAAGTHVPYGITQSNLPPSRGDIPTFTPNDFRLVLDLATPKGCKAELT